MLLIMINIDVGVNVNDGDNDNAIESMVLMTTNHGDICIKVALNIFTVTTPFVVNSLPILVQFFPGQKPSSIAN